MNSNKIFVLSLCLALFLTGSSRAEEAKIIQPLSLEKSLNIALENNPQVTSARSKVRAAEGKLGEAYSLILPTLKADYSLTRYYSDPTVMHVEGFPGGQDIVIGYRSPYNIHKTGLSVTEYFFTGGTIPTLLIAQNGLKAARANLRQVNNEVALAVTESYYHCLQAMEFLALARESVATTSAHLKQVKIMLDTGVATKADLLQGEVQIAQAEQALIDAENGVETAKYVFNNLLGRNLETPLVIEEINFRQEVSRLKIDNLSPAGLLKKAFEKRPDWLALNFNKKVSEHSVGLASAGYWPALFGTFSYDWQNTFLPEGRWNDVKSWTAVAGVSLSLFDGGSTPARVLQARANLADTQAQLEAARRSVELEVKQSLLDLNSSYRKFGVALKTVNLAGENLRIALLRFQAQASTELEVQSARTNLVSARASLIKSAFDYLISWEKLKKASGEDLLEI